MWNPYSPCEGCPFIQSLNPLDIHLKYFKNSSDIQISGYPPYGGYGHFLEKPNMHFIISDNSFTTRRIEIQYFVDKQLNKMLNFSFQSIKLSVLKINTISFWRKPITISFWNFMLFLYFFFSLYYQTGRRLVFRSCPPQTRKREDVTHEKQDKEEEELKYFFTWRNCRLIVNN